MPDYLDIGNKLVRVDVGLGGNPLTPTHGDKYTRKDLNRSFEFNSALQWGLGLWVTEPRPLVLPVDTGAATQPYAQGSNITSGYHSFAQGAWGQVPNLPYLNLSTFIESTSLRGYFTGAQSVANYWTYVVNCSLPRNDAITVWTANSQFVLGNTTRWQRFDSAPQFYVPRNNEAILYWQLLSTGTNGSIFTSYPLIMIREVAPQVPEEISGMTFWYNSTLLSPHANNDALNVVYEAGNASGFAQLRQATGANQPLFKTNVAGAGATLPITRFDGTNDYLVADDPGDSSYNIATPTIFAVFKCTAGPTLIQGIFSKSDATIGTAGREKLMLLKGYNGSQPTVRWDGGNGTPLIEVAVPDIISLGQFRSVCVQSRAANDHTIYVDGVASNFSTTLDLTTYNTAQVTIGTTSSTTPSNYFAGDVAEIILYNRALSAAEIARVQAYLKTKWGTP